MNKQHIINEIIRTAKENNNVPLGQRQIEKETGIKATDWFGKYWAKWGDAVREAGFTANTLQGAYEKEHLIKELILLIREIRKFPSRGDIRLKTHNSNNFPSDQTFDRGLGTTTKKANAIIRSHLINTKLGVIANTMTLSSVLKD